MHGDRVPQGEIANDIGIQRVVDIFDRSARIAAKVRVRCAGRLVVGTLGAG